MCKVQVSNEIIHINATTQIIKIFVLSVLLSVFNTANVLVNTVFHRSHVTDVQKKMALAARLARLSTKLLRSEVCHFLKFTVM